MSHIYKYLDYQVKCDDGKGRLKKREFQMPEIDKELEEYKERTDDFMTGFGDGGFFPRTTTAAPLSEEHQKMLSNVSHGEDTGSPRPKDHQSIDKIVAHKSLSMIVNSKIKNQFQLQLSNGKAEKKQAKKKESSNESDDEEDASKLLP